MNLVNTYMICDKCKSEFSRENYPVTIACGHNICANCISSLKKNNFICERDNIKQDLPTSPSIDYLNFIELIKSISELYKPIKFHDPTKIDSKLQSTFSHITVKKKTEICTYYLRGCCRFGDNCWFLHNRR